MKTTSDASIVNFLLLTHFAHYSIVNIVEFEQINAVWDWETVVSDNKFVFSNSEKYIVLWAGGICFHLYSPNIRLQKNKFLWQHSKKISRTLESVKNFPFWFYWTLPWYFRILLSLITLRKNPKCIYYHCEQFMSYSQVFIWEIKTIFGHQKKYHFCFFSCLLKRNLCRSS